MVAFSNESDLLDQTSVAYLVAVCVSPGGIPKLQLDEVRLTISGLAGDGRNHSKHIRPDRAVSLWDYETLRQLVAEGFSSLTPGAAGENLTVVGLNVQAMTPGTLLRIGDTVLKLEQPRKPCYVLDAIDPRLKDVIVGRCGFLASVVREGTLRPGMKIEVIFDADMKNAGLVAPDTSVGRGSPDPAPQLTAGLPVSAETLSPAPSTRAYHLLAGPTIG